MGIAAIQILNQSSPIEVKDGALVAGNKWKHLLNPFHHQREMQKLIEHIQSQILAGPQIERQSYLLLADRLISEYTHELTTKDLLKIFDRTIAPYRQELAYRHCENQEFFEKWKIAHQPPAIFRDFPSFAEFLRASHILSGLKISRDTVQLIDGRPALLVKGQWLQEAQIHERFEIVYSKRWKQTFVIEKETRKVFTYLDNGNGLQEHHPFLDAKTPISKLDENDYRRTRHKAKEFIRPEEANLNPTIRAHRNHTRPYILQLISSNVAGPDTNFHNLIVRPRHTFIRLIAGEDNPELGFHKGDVFEFGFNMKSSTFLPAVTQKGQFVTPDPWEYKTPLERIVTNIALSSAEARNLYDFTMKYHLDGINLGNEIGFHITQHNCTVYFREACKAAGIHVPTQIDLEKAIARVTPEILRRLGQQMREWAENVGTWFHRGAERFVHPQILTAVADASNTVKNFLNKIKDVFVAFMLTPIGALLGGFWGQGGVALRQNGQPTEEIRPPLRNFWDWFKISSYTLNLPGIVQQWQRQQPSTVIYENHPQLTLVAPA